MKTNNLKNFYKNKNKNVLVTYSFSYIYMYTSKMSDDYKSIALPTELQGLE